MEVTHHRRHHRRLRNLTFWYYSLCVCEDSAGSWLEYFKVVLLRKNSIKLFGLKGCFGNCAK